MPTIMVTTEIEGPIERCFDLARDVEVHRRTAAFTKERVVGGKLSGLLELGDQVTFEGVHFGIRQRLTSKIVEMDRPHRFVDEMVSGAFKSLRHVHDFEKWHVNEFETSEYKTVMTDIITWVSPFGILGRIADLFAGPHLLCFLRRRNQELKLLAEEAVV